MEYMKLVSKSVLDRNGKKLGLVVRVDDFFDSMTMEQATPFAIIKLSNPFKRNNFFPLPLVSARQFQVVEDSVYLDISKKDFMRMYKLYNEERKLKVKSAKFKDVNAQDAAMAKMWWGKI
ncbi:MAG: hypothetical protein FK731_11985 [Asgard group archaeon]|nr:hypothetical protein [Asgard group archaeon]